MTGFGRVQAGCVQQDRFCARPVGRVSDRDRHLFPDERKVPRIIEDGLGEDLRVADRDDPAGELPAVHPHRGVGTLHAGRLTHLHDRGLDEAETHDVAADAAHGDAVTDGEGIAAKNDEVAGHRGDDLLQRESQARRHQAERRREPGRVAEPDRKHAEDQDDGGDQADPLSGPEPGLDARAVGPPGQQADQRTQGTAGQDQDGDEDQRQQQLAPVVGRDADPIDTEKMHCHLLLGRLDRGRTDASAWPR